MTRYWATSETTVSVPCKELSGTGLHVEFNPKIESNGKKGMYRLNGRDLPFELMGYELYKTVLINRYRRFKTKMRNRG